MKMMEDERPALHFKGRAAPGERTQVLALRCGRRCGRRGDGLRGIPRAGYVHAHGAKQKRKDEHRLKRFPSSCKERTTPNYKVAYIISTLAKMKKFNKVQGLLGKLASLKQCTIIFKQFPLCLRCVMKSILIMREPGCSRHSYAPAVCS